MNSLHLMKSLFVSVSLVQIFNSDALAQQIPDKICGTTEQALSKSNGGGVLPTTVPPNPTGKNFKVAALYVKTSDDYFDTGDCQTADWDTTSASPDWAGQLLISTPFNSSTVNTDTAAKPKSLTTYYYRMSNGNLWLYGDEVTYTGPSITIASEDGNETQFKANNRSILQWYINNYDLTSLDNDSNGEVDMIMLVCRSRAGFGYSGIAYNYVTSGIITGSPGEPVIRGSSNFNNSGTYQTDCYNLADARGLCAHEVGHHLFLNTSHYNGLHRWNLMSGAGGTNPPRSSGVTMSAFEKNRVLWLSYQDINVTTFDTSLSNLSLSNNAIRIPITGSSHYFIVENRQYSYPFEMDPAHPEFCPPATHTTIPGTGLLVSYYNGTEASIRPADGSVAIVNGNKNGDTSDLFPNGGITQITPYTNPNTNTSSGANTHIAIKNIHYSGSNIVFDVYHNYWEGVISTNTTWSGTVYVGADVTVNSGVTLTVSPGTTVKFASGKKLTVNGSLVANSTDPAQRITFTGATTPDFWGGIKINSGNSTNVSTLRRCDVTYATTGITITYSDNSNDVTVEKCRIGDNSNDGIYVYGRSTATTHPTISNSHIHDNGSSGIRLQNYARPTVTGNRIEYHPEYGIYASGSSSAKVEFNYLGENGRAGMAFHSNSHAEVHRNTVTQNLDDAGIYITSSSNLIAYGGTDTNKGRNKIVANNYGGIFSTSSSPVFGRDVTNPTNQYGYNQIEGNGHYQASQSGSGQLQAERCYWGADLGDVSGNVDYSPHLTSVPSPVGWGQTDGYDPSTRVLINPGLIVDDGQENAPWSTESVDQNNATSTDFHPAGWSAKFDAAMKTGLGKGEWADAAEVITELWRELQDSHVPAVDYALLAGYAEQPRVESSIRKYLALTLVEKSLAVQDISTALNDLAKYRQSNPDHSAELLANIGIINLHFKNDLAAAEEVLSQLHALAAQNDEAANEQAKLLSVMIENYRQYFGTATMSKPASYALAPVTEVETSLLVENYPNPFNPETMIRYRVSGQHAQNVSLVIFNTVGQRVRTLVAARQNPGSYSVQWDGRDNFGKEAASGMYFLRAVIAGEIMIRKLMLVR